jgi:hypothetical protein
MWHVSGISLGIALDFLLLDGRLVTEDLRSLIAGRFDFSSSSRSARSSPDELLDLFLPIPPPLGSLQLVGSVSVLRAYELMRAHAFALLMRIVAQGI